MSQQPAEFPADLMGPERQTAEVKRELGRKHPDRIAEHPASVPKVVHRPGVSPVRGVLWTMHTAALMSAVYISSRADRAPGGAVNRS